MTITYRAYDNKSLFELLSGYLLSVSAFLGLALVVTVNKHALKQLIAFRISII